MKIGIVGAMAQEVEILVNSGLKFLSFTVNIPTTFVP